VSGPSTRSRSRPGHGRTPLATSLRSLDMSGALPWSANDSAPASNDPAAVLQRIEQNLLYGVRILVVVVIVPGLAITFVG